MCVCVCVVCVCCVCVCVCVCCVCMCCVCMCCVMCVCVIRQLNFTPSMHSKSFYKNSLTWWALLRINT